MIQKEDIEKEVVEIEDIEDMEKDKKALKNKLEKYLSRRIDRFAELYSNFKFTIFVFGIVAIMSFLIVYGFLYGYYFGGDFESTISNFNVISNFVPFDIRTMSIISFYFLCIFYIIYNIVSLVKKGNSKIWLVFILLCVSLILNIMLTLFFSSSIEIKSILGFSLIWIFIGALVWGLFILVKIINETSLFLYGSVSTVFFCIMIYCILALFKVDEVVIKDILFISLIVLWPTLTTLYIYFSNKRWMIFVSCLPITLIFLLGVKYFWEILHGYVLLIAVLLLNFITFYLTMLIKRRLDSKNNKKSNELVNESEDTKDNSDTSEEQEKYGFLYESLKKLYVSLVIKNDQLDKFKITAVLLLAFVTILHASLLFGKGLRTANFSKDNQLEIIYVENGSKQEITANYYIEKDSVLYISNENWKLEIIKPMNYHIRPKE
ncbi:hypothetical protein [Lysinibacillus sp. NPDC093216]|uniref:hypothetical protein n=1 Tax=Lysinibacillus sp. NPDC093216 TaxID=3390576 RepID=UPI003D04CB67